MLKTLQSYKECKSLNDKNVFLDRLVKANPNAYMEAINMWSDDIKEIFLEGAEKYGWLEDKFVDKKQIAKKFLLLGVSVEKVAEATELPVETVMDLR